MALYELKTQKTRNEILKSFEELLCVKEFDKIKISDITEKANITRGTFYNHYGSIYDLLEASIKKLWGFKGLSFGSLAKNDIAEYIKTKTRQSYINLRKNPKLAITAFELMTETPYLYHIYDEMLNTNIQFQNNLLPKNKMSENKKKFLSKSISDITIITNINMLNEDELTEDEFCDFFCNIFLDIYLPFYKIKD